MDEQLEKEMLDLLGECAELSPEQRRRRIRGFVIMKSREHDMPPGPIMRALDEGRARVGTRVARAAHLPRHDAQLVRRTR